MSIELTPKERRLVNAYIISGNAKESARQAGYKGSDDVLGNLAHRVLRKDKIRRHIAERMAEADVTANEVIGTLVSQMRCDVTDLLDENGQFDLPAIKRRRLGHLIKAVTIKRSLERIPTDDGVRFEPIETMRIELHSSQSAANQLCKVLGIEREAAPNRDALIQAVKEYMTRTGKAQKDAIEALKVYIPQVVQVASELIQ